MIFEGVIGLTKDRLFPGSLEYFIGDGVHKYSELPKYGGAEASILSKAYTLVLRDANGKIDSSSIDFPEVPDATPTIKGIVKASATKAADNVVKSDADGSLDGWREALADTLADANGGLIKNPSTGKLNVDFSQMPTDKFEELLKSLKMLIPLSADMDLYVDTNNAAAGDTIIDGRGTASKPFKTIQACVNFATSTYAIGNHVISIKIVAGTYNECVDLPNFSRGTGYIQLIPASGLKDVIVNSVTNSAGTCNYTFTAKGGTWVLKSIIAQRVESPTSSNSYPIVGCYAAENNGTILSLYGCSATQSMPDSPVPLGGNNYVMRLIAADNGGTLRIRHGNFAHEIATEKPESGYPGITVFSVGRGGTLTFYKSSSNSVNHDVNCSGSCDTFLNVWQNGTVNSVATGSALSFNGTMTGKKYALTSGGTAATGGTGADYFPGDEAGTVESSTYCWYQ